MIPEFEDDGVLPPGVHNTTWAEFCQRFGASPRRQILLEGLKKALQSLKAAGCIKVYIDGSFVTAKTEPEDYDGCWELQGVNPILLDPILLTFVNRRVAQKAKYRGELFPAHWEERGSGTSWLQFFQRDKTTGGSKGIIAIDLRSAQL